MGALACVFFFACSFFRPTYSDEPVPVLAPCYECHPMLFEWEGGVHHWNLVGVKYAFWSPTYVASVPPMQFRSHRVVMVHYWSTKTALSVGDTLTYSGFSPTWISNANDSDTTRIVGGNALVTATSDSTMELRATIHLTCRTWTKDQFDTSYVTVMKGR